MSFSAAQASLEGFRLVRRRPVSFVVWSLLMGATMAAFATGYVWMFRDLAAWIATAKANAWQGILPMVGRFLLFELSAVIVLVVIVAMIAAAVYRATLSPAQSVFAYLRLGRAELRLIALQLLMMVLTTLSELAAVGVIVGAAVSSLVLVAKILIAIGVVAGLIALVVFVLVRLSLAGPLIVATDRFDLRRAWAMTRGRFWPLLGMSLLAFLLAMVVSMPAQIPIQLFMMTAMGPVGAFGAGHIPPDPWSYVRANPALSAVIGVLAILSMGLQLAVQAAPFAAAYRDLSEPS